MTAMFNRFNGITPSILSVDFAKLVPNAERSRPRAPIGRISM